MGDWEDIFGSEGMEPDFAPWDAPGWADDHDDISNEEEYEIDVKERYNTLVILSNLLERANTNKKVFTKMERKAIKFAIAVLSSKNCLKNLSEPNIEATTTGWGQPKSQIGWGQPKSSDNETPVDTDDDDIAF
ncbi:hypothetical protein FC652_09720 [Vibrio sp. 05-20-BW147]|uniref:hypothetical protein n=1 Tax=Vibrio sp. 05-20-BW147 TaxID=2575834 RepID=UPI001592C2B6|nr:hypothetical protein [Vibrio sp. 05-20-BW147]NVC63406.1 hypothetical protein [Vibrio sp. 05-20-BW147]